MMNLLKTNLKKQRNKIINKKKLRDEIERKNSMKKTMQNKKKIAIKRIMTKFDTKIK
jgi:hypothetical protein